MALSGWIKAKDVSPAVWLVSIGMNVVVLGSFAGLYAWRINTFERTIATVIAVRTVEKPLRHERRRTVTMGELSFERTAKDGTIIPCRHEFEIGRPVDGYRAGDKFEVVVATGTCQRLDILRPVARRP